MQTTEEQGTMAEREGEIVGNWQLAEPIGTGGMGVVYRASHRYLEREAAVKVLHPHLAGDSMFRARFLQEARAVSRLDHPRVLSLLDFGADDERHYLVMPLLPDGTLRTLLRQRDAADSLWSLALGLELVRQAAEGLAYAHAMDMVHRDIKPDNLLLRAVDPADEPDEAQPWPWSLCVGDFGLARLADSSRMTASGMTMGTPAYMSPEQCQGLDVDGRCDIYALGVVLYEVVTGKVPFPARTLSEAVYQHVFTPPTPPHLTQPDLPPELEAIILRCLAKSPDERVPTMEALEAELRAVQANMPVPAVPPASSSSAIVPERDRATDIVAAPDISLLEMDMEIADLDVERATAADPDAPAQHPLPVGHTPLAPLAPLESAPRTVTPAEDAEDAGHAAEHPMLTAPRVVVTASDGQVVAAARLTGDGLRVGRLSSNTLVLPQQGVSRNHVQIDWDGEQATVTDLGSSNGTLLGTVRLMPHLPQPWPADTLLRIGPLRVQLLAPDAPASASASAPAPAPAAPAASEMPRPPAAPLGYPTAPVTQQSATTDAPPVSDAVIQRATQNDDAGAGADADADVREVIAMAQHDHPQEQVQEVRAAQASAAFVARRSAIEAALPSSSAPPPQPVVPQPRVREVTTPPFKREPRASAIRLPLLLLLLTLVIAATVFGVMYLAA